MFIEHIKKAIQMTTFALHFRLQEHMAALLAVPRIQAAIGREMFTFAAHPDEHSYYHLRKVIESINDTVIEPEEKHVLLAFAQSNYRLYDTIRDKNACDSLLARTASKQISHMFTLKK